MFKQRGFTIIEIMVVIVIIMILVSVAMTASNKDSHVSFGLNGVTESRCIDGYKFIIDGKGNARQILDEFGKGARCETVSRQGGM